MEQRVTLDDISLSSYTLNNLPLVKKLREEHFRKKTEVCIERAKYITHYLKELSPPDEPAQIRRAMAVNYYLSKRTPFFPGDNLLAGSTTSKEIGAPLYPELLGLTIWPELETIGTRKVNPQYLSEEDARYCNLEIFPYWIDKNILEVTRSRFNDPECMKLMEKVVFYLCGKAGCISHCVPSYEYALHTGLDSLIRDAKKSEIKAEKSENTEERKKAEFYRSVRIAMEGIVNYANNLSQEAIELSKNESDPEKKRNLEEMGRICAKVPAKPARTYREAVNSLWLCQVAILAENINMALSPGRLDQILYPFYQKDRKENGLSIEEALNISCCLWLKISDNTNLIPETAERLWGGAGSTPAVTLGGVDKNGDDAVNDLTYIFLKVTELMRLRDPSVNARYHYEKNRREYRDRVSEVIVNTKAIPAFHNDEADIGTLVNQGLTKEHARDYAIVGCVELASQGRDYVASSSIMLNLAAAMEMVLFNGKRKITGDEQVGPLTGDPENFSSFHEFWEAFKIQLKWLMEQAIEMNEYLGLVHQEILPTPLLSAFFQGPMESGKDLIFGGALYNSSGASHVAFPDVCDSLNAIEFSVFQKKHVSMKELIEAVKNNFESPEQKKLTVWIKKNVPRFGTMIPLAIKNSKNLIGFIYEVYQSHTNYRGGPYRPSYWTMTIHAGQGKLAGALPSGRVAHEVFSSGITPASQAAQSLTGAFSAVASLPYKEIPGGEALNIKYTPMAVGEKKEDYIKRFGDLVDGYFSQGGLQVQFNIQTYQDLIKAKEDPEFDPQMIVRVSGYSAYFKDLSDAMKDELITRTQYNLCSGAAVPVPLSWKRACR